MSQSPKLEDVLEEAINSYATEHYTAVPGRVESYDKNNQLATIAIEINEVDYLPDGRGVTTYPIIKNVPIMFPGSGNFRITFPVEAGDKVLFIVSTFDIHKWQKTGKPVSIDWPAIDRNKFSAGFAIPGLFAGKRPPEPSGSGDTGIVLHNNHKNIKLGSNASEFVATEATMDTFMFALEAAIEAGNNSGTAPGATAATTLTYLKEALDANFWPQNHVATKVKAE